MQALADDLGARAQPFVRKCLPGRKVDDLRGIRTGTDGEAAEILAQRLGFAPGGGDHEQRFGLAQLPATSEHRGQQRGPHPFGKRKIGVSGGEAEGVFERGGARKRCD